MFQLMKGDEVARAELTVLRNELERMAAIVSALSEQIGAQQESLRELREQSERTTALESQNADLRRDLDKLRVATERESRQRNADIAKLERQAEIDLRETRTNDQSLAELLLELRRKLDDGPEQTRRQNA